MPPVPFALLPPVLLGALVAAQQQAPSQGSDHWAFHRPEPPALPTVATPDWVREPVDAFVLSRLEAAGLAPAPAAGRATLVRRLALDLTGLPPSPAEVTAFLADDRVDAYERLVDRLLASPHYGERMALRWLDLARYADTNGYLNDGERDVWRWRDWAVAAWNENMRFDRFTVAQLAGDLLPEATVDDRIATGFLRLHPLENEGVGLPGEYHHRHVADRIATIGTTWLGLTVGCAECHDHMYDPLSQRDYYRLFAFFDNTADGGLVRGRGMAPTLALPDAAQATRLLELQQRLDDLQAEREELAALREPEAAAHHRVLVREAASTPIAAGGPLRVHAPLDGEVQGVAEVRGVGRIDWVPGIRGSAARFDGNDSVVDLGDRGGIALDRPFAISAWVQSHGFGGLTGATIAAKVDEAGNGRGFWFGLAGDRLWFSLVGDEDAEDELAVRTRHRIARRRWVHVAASYDGSRRVDGITLWIDGVRWAVDSRRADTVAGDPSNPAALRIGGADDAGFHGVIDELRITDRALTAAELARVIDADLRAAALRAGADPAIAALLRRDFGNRHDPDLRRIDAAIRETAALRDRLRDGVTTTPVLRERAERRPTCVRPRGDFRVAGERVDPGVPELVLGWPEGAPRNRLGFARWLVHPDHPLVGRVFVNRIWCQLFGRGLVATLDDFGSRGARPTHPQLLDWLARDFVDGGFDVKRLVRMLVNSATYRQRSTVGERAYQADPANALLARGGRWRLPAELLRDHALVAAALLDPTVGGPPVRPPQPADLWPGDRATPLDESHRRGLYVHVRRSSPYMPFALFDAPTREVCVARRAVTTTPLQALAQWNDPVAVAAAHALGQRMIGAGRDDDARLSYGHLACLSRPPLPAERAVFSALLARLRAVAPGDDEVVWGHVAAVLLNLDEAQTRG